MQVSRLLNKSTCKAFALRVTLNPGFFDTQQGFRLD